MKLFIEYSGEETGFLIYDLGKDDKNRNIAYIKYISVLEKYRGKGMAISLLWYLYDILLTRKIRYVEFDDCSDLYRNKKNIYTKVGAKYIKNNGPEMIWKIWTKYTKNLREKYTKNTNNKYKIREL
jgi:hypothetical protein